MVLIIDSQIAGISGDMILSSLVDLGADKSKIIDGVKSAEEFLNGAKIKKIDFTKTKKHGIEATELILELDDHSHERKGTEIQNCINKTSEKINLSTKASNFANSSIQTLIEAESKIHGEPTSSVHFHEASSFDTIVDILGTAIALDDLHLFDEEIICTPVAVGSGNITFSHGTTSNPAGAILEIFKNSSILISGNQTKDELTTPTGACLLRNLATTCQEFYPTMQIDLIGYGAGKKNFEGFSNVLKLIRGAKNDNYVFDSVKILETNVDDVSGEVLGHMIEKIMENGAKDVTVSSAITKKGRPTHLVTVICDSNSVNSLTKLLISETGTLGVRIRTSQRITVSRSLQNISVNIGKQDFMIRIKTNDESNEYKIESDDIRSISKSIDKSFRETEELIRNEISKKMV